MYVVLSFKILTLLWSTLVAMETTSVIGASKSRIHLSCLFFPLVCEYSSSFPPTLRFICSLFQKVVLSKLITAASKLNARLFSYWRLSVSADLTLILFGKIKHQWFCVRGTNNIHLKAKKLQHLFIFTTELLRLEVTLSKLTA